MIHSLRNIVVTGRTTERTRLSAIFKDVNVSIIFLPTIQVIPKELGERDSSLLKRLADYDYIFFTSTNSVKLFSTSLQTHHIRMLRNIPKIVAVGPSTANACRKLGWHVSYMPKKFDSLNMTQTIKSLNGKDILFPRSSIAPLGIVTSMRSQGAKVTVILLYTTQPILHSTRLLRKVFENRMIDYITFMSSSSVRSLSRSLSNSSLRLKVLSIPIVCIGPKTAYTAKRMGFNHIMVAETATSQGITRLVEHMVRT